MRNKVFLIAFGFLFTSGASQAALYDRGSGLIYDADLNITWMQNANLASTNSFSLVGINANGSMDWNTANNWITALNTSNYLGYQDWRLPTMLIPDATCGGGYDGYSLNCSGSELGHLFYQELGNKAPYNTSGVFQSDYGLKHTSPFANLEANSYWTSTEWGQNSAVAYRFDFNYGGVDETGKNFSFPLAWAVRDGDVTSPVPEPETYALMLAGLGMMGFMVRRRKGCWRVASGIN